MKDNNIFSIELDFANTFCKHLASNAKQNNNLIDRPDNDWLISLHKKFKWRVLLLNDIQTEILKKTVMKNNKKDIRGWHKPHISKTFSKIS